MNAIDKIGSAFLRRILIRMKQLGVSQAELAKRMQVSRPYITKVLHQDVNITFRTAAKLASALKMDFFPDLGMKKVANVTHSPLSGFRCFCIMARVRRLYCATLL